MKRLMAEHIRKILAEVDDANNPQLTYVDDDGRQRVARAETLRKYDPSHPGRQAYERWKQTAQPTATDTQPVTAPTAAPSDTTAATLSDELKDITLQYSDEGGVKQGSAAELANAPEGSGARKRYERFMDGVTFERDNAEFQAYAKEQLEQIKNAPGKGRDVAFPDYKDPSRQRSATDKKIAQDGVAHQGYHELIKKLYDEWVDSRTIAPTTQEPVAEPEEVSEPVKTETGRRTIVDADGKVTLKTKQARDPKSQASKLIAAINSGDEAQVKAVVKRMRLSVNRNGKLFSYATGEKVLGGSSETEKIDTYDIVTLLREKYGIQVHGSENLINPEDPKQPKYKFMPSTVYSEATPVDMKISDGGKTLVVDGAKLSVVTSPSQRTLVVENELSEIKRRNAERGIEMSDDEVNERAKRAVSIVETYNRRIRFIQSELRNGASFVTIGTGSDAVGAIGRGLKEAASNVEGLSSEHRRIFSEQIDTLTAAESVEDLDSKWEDVRKKLLTIPTIRDEGVLPYICEHIQGMRDALRDRKVIFPARGTFRFGDVLSVTGKSITGLNLRDMLDSIDVMDVVVDITGVKEREGAPSVIGTRIDTATFRRPNVADDLRVLGGSKTRESSAAIERIFDGDINEARQSIMSVVQNNIRDIRSYYKIPDSITDDELIEGLSRGAPPQYNESGEFAGFGNAHKAFSGNITDTNRQQLELYSLSGYAFDGIYNSNIVTQGVGLVSFGVSEITEANGMRELDRSQFEFGFTLRKKPDGSVRAEAFRSRVLSSDVEGVRTIASSGIQQEIIVEHKFRMKKGMLKLINEILSEENTKSKAARDAEQMGLVKKPGVGLYGPPGDENPATHRSVGGELTQLGTDVTPRVTEPTTQQPRAEEPRPIDTSAPQQQQQVTVANNIRNRARYIRDPQRKQILGEMANAIEAGDAAALQEIINKYQIVLSSTGKLKARGIVGGAKYFLTPTEKQNTPKEIFDIAAQMGVTIQQQPNINRQSFKPSSILPATDNVTSEVTVGEDKKVTVTYMDNSTDPPTELQKFEQYSTEQDDIVAHADEWMEENKGRISHLTDEQVEVFKKRLVSLIRERRYEHNRMVWEMSQLPENGRRVRILKGTEGMDELIGAIENKMAEMGITDGDEFIELLRNLRNVPPNELVDRVKELINAIDNSSLDRARPYLVELVTAVMVIDRGDVAMVPSSEQFPLADIIGVRNDGLIGESEMYAVFVEMGIGGEEAELLAASGYLSVKSEVGAASSNDEKIKKTRFKYPIQGATDPLLERNPRDDITDLYNRHTSKGIFKVPTSNDELDEHQSKTMEILERYEPEIRKYYNFAPEAPPTIEEIYEMLSSGNKLTCGENGQAAPSGDKSVLLSKSKDDLNRRQWELSFAMGRVTEAVYNSTMEYQSYSSYMFSADQGVVVADGRRIVTAMVYAPYKNTAKRKGYLVPDSGQVAYTSPTTKDKLETYGDPCQ